MSQPIYINADDPMTRLRAWRVNYFLPKTEPEHYGKNFSPIVLAKNIEEALAIVREKHPTAVPWAVNHLGTSV